MKFTIRSTLVLGCLFIVSAIEARAEEDVINLCSSLSEDQVYQGDDEDFKKLIAGKDGWIFRTEHDLKQKGEEFDLSEGSINSFKRLRQALQNNGTELAVAMIPTRGLIGYPYLLPPYDTSYNQAQAKAEYIGLLEELKNSGIIVADTSQADTVPGFFLKRDNHWTATGARYVAQKMAEAIKAHPMYEGLVKAEFETTSAVPGEPVLANYNFLEFIEKNCGTKVEREKITELFTTNRKQGTGTQDELLGETAAPEVVLLGTSNSTDPQPSYANFAGFLRESLGIDVHNDSIKGGSMRGAMSNYVLSGDYKKYKPKLIIWELSASYGFKQRSFFREIIPAIYGACSDEQAIVKAEGQVKPKETVILKDLADKNMVSNNYYLVLELEDKDEREVKVGFLHVGRDEPNSIKFERSLRNFPTNDGLYFAEVKDDIEDPVESIAITLKNGKGGYKAKMCKMPE